MTTNRPLAAFMRVLAGCRLDTPRAIRYRLLHPLLPMAAKHRLYTTSFASVYPYYVAKAERKGRKSAEVDAIICWLTGYPTRALKGHLRKQTTFEAFFAEASKPNPARLLVRGTICGVRVEEIKEPLMREIRILDKLVDALARGKPLEKILSAG